MPYITIHPIKTTLRKSINYICKAQKTESQENIYCEYCDFRTADTMFERTKRNHSSSTKMLAYHIIQSFPEGEVTTEQAMEIGIETMNRFLNKEYEYVLAVHNDTKHIHNHIIVNSVNMINGKSFSYELDRKRYPAWKRLYDISTQIAKEKGLSIIENPEKTTKSHYEWSMDKKGISWKTQLKKFIDQTIRNADNFDDFLQKLRSQNVTVRYEDYKIKEGKILAFKIDGQKNFIYSQKLGKYYSENTIKARIERSVKRRNIPPTERRKQRILADNGKLKKLYDISEFDSIGLKEWAKNQNRKIQMQTLNELHDKGFLSAYEFYQYHTELEAEISQNSEYYAHLKQQKKELQIQLKYVEIYREYKEIYDYYTTETMYPDRYFRKHENEILLFEEAKTELERYVETIPNKAQLAHKISDWDDCMTELLKRQQELREEFYSYEIIKYNLDLIYEKVENQNSEKYIEPQHKNNHNIEL